MSSSRLPQSPGGPPRKQVTKTIASLITQCNLERRPPPAQPLTAAELQEEVHEAKERSKVPMDQESLKRWMAFTDEDVENARRKDIEQSADDLVNAFLNPHGSSHAGRVMLPPPQPQPQPQPQPPVIAQPKNEQWPCVTCTFLNDSDLAACTMCATPRG